MPSLHAHQLQHIKTDDGSYTLQRTESGLLYRSQQGAAQESLAVFVYGSHLPARAQNWNVFELGLGQGCNFLYTYQEAEKYGVKLHYTAVDHLPIPSSFAQHPLVCEALAEVRSHPEKSTVQVCDDIATLTLHACNFMTLDLDLSVDAIFHDPFGPAANPACWTRSCFQKEAMLLSHNGIWSSYGAAGHMRRELARAGLFVARGPSVGKKRETTRASHNEHMLKDYPIKYRPSQFK